MTVSLRRFYYEHWGMTWHVLLWGHRGKPLLPFRKLFFFRTLTGVNESRVAASGHPLPNARMLSYTVHPEVIVTDPLSTHMTMLFGQFLDHDITHAQTIREAKFVNNLGDPFVNASGRHHIHDPCFRYKIAKCECWIGVWNLKKMTFYFLILSEVGTDNTF